MTGQLRESRVDCEKFDKVALEMLYDELDELTSAAVKRHMDHCSRCGSVGARLRATREVGVLPILTPPSGLEQRILRLEREARQGLPLRQRVGRAISVMAGYAMRPQLAMAALLLLMIGSSFLFLRAKPGDTDSVHVTERGIREADESVAIVPLPERPSGDGDEETKSAPARTQQPAGEPARQNTELAERAKADTETDLGAASLEADETTYEKAMGAFRRGEYAVARQEFEAIAEKGGDQAASARLYAAHSARNSVGCSMAAPKFDDVYRRYPGTSIAQEAAWQAAGCYRSLGQLDLARAHYNRLLDVPAYADRAQHALSRLDQQQGQAVASRAASAPAKKAAKATRPAATGGTAGKPAAAKVDSSVSSKQSQ